MTTILKTIDVEVKDADLGIVEAVIATLNVVDKDGDLTLPGFFGTQKNVPILWGHNWEMMPLGLADITEKGDKAILTGRFNLDSAAGKEALAVLKFQGDSQQWSYGFSIKTGGSTFIPDDERGEHQGANRLLQPLSNGDPGSKVAEASPVVVGAGEGTMTVSVKAADPSVKLADHVSSVTDDLTALAGRVSEVRTLRKEGKLGEQTKDRLNELGQAMIAMGRALADTADSLPIDDDDPPKDDDPPEQDAEPVITDDDLLVMAETEDRLRGS